MSTITANRTTAKRRKSRAKRRIKVPEVVSSHAVAFIAVFGLTYFISSLSGQVMVEKARQEFIRANQKALDARKVEAELSKRLDSMTSLESIKDWAKTHNFKSLDELSAPQKTAGASESTREGTSKVALASLKATPVSPLISQASPTLQIPGLASDTTRPRRHHRKARAKSRVGDAGGAVQSKEADDAAAR
jgi:hypothetical protein